MDIRDKVSKDWLNFEKDLKYSNRFFVDPEFQKNLIKAIDLHSGKLSGGIILFRSRIKDSEPFNIPFEAKDMGAPPNHKTVNNRANTIGISYLYTSLIEPICINELRPGIGQYLTIAKFTLNQDIRIVDFYSPIPIPEDKYIEYLALKLHSTFTRPIIYGKADIEYLPFQFISELIKKQNFQGVLYHSLFGKNFYEREDSNLVIFNENNVTPDPKTYLVKILKVNVDYDKC